ncbi:MAG TPA: serine hydrolase domain-containing protein [Gemmatirosa sp.]|nr:serine hydrolase domain-containing protein [Gemmatirosa sp.]
MRAAALVAAAVLATSPACAGVGPVRGAATAGGGASQAHAHADSLADDVVRRWMAEHHLPGVALAVVREGRVVLARGHGIADIARRTPVRPETPFQIASVTKSFTAVATLMLVAEGRLALDAPVGRYLPELPAAWRPATSRQLLGHTSGIPSISAFERPPCDAGRAQADYRQGDVLREVACLPLAFAPGERWAYGDTGYYLLGRIIAALTGDTYEAFLRARMFAPLGMADTRLQRRPPLPDVAQGYRWAEGRHEPVPPLDPMVDEANGALVSTVHDLARWGAALHTGRLLPAAVRDTMWTPVPVRTGAAPYGLGFGLTPFAGRRRVGHTGGGPDCATAFSIFPDDRLTVILLANGELPQGRVQVFANEIAAVYLAPGPPR